MKSNEYTERHKMNFSHIKQFVGVILLSVFIFVFSSATAQAQDNDASISIPTIGVNAPIVFAPRAGNTWDASHLNMTVGQFEGMPWFGTNSNVVLGGHSLDMQGRPDVFFNLAGMGIGVKKLLSMRMV
jgi:sortase (surface protein transpeptidase)